MSIPQEEHLLQVVRLILAMGEAASTLERVGLTVDDLLAGLDEARNEVVTEHFGAAFMDEIESLVAQLNTGNWGSAMLEDPRTDHPTARAANLLQHETILPPEDR